MSNLSQIMQSGNPFDITATQACRIASQVKKQQNEVARADVEKVIREKIAPLIREEMEKGEFSVTVDLPLKWTADHIAYLTAFSNQAGFGCKKYADAPSSDTRYKFDWGVIENPSPTLSKQHPSLTLSKQPPYVTGPGY